MLHGFYLFFFGDSDLNLANRRLIKILSRNALLCVYLVFIRGLEPTFAFEFKSSQDSLSVFMNFNYGNDFL